MASASNVLTVTVTTSRDFGWRWPARSVRWFGRLSGKPLMFRVFASVYLGTLRIKVGG